MPPRTALSTPLRAWRCPQCRTFATSRSRLALGPEHPRYIEVPEPPQQSAPYLPFIKGRLPVPRDVFAGSKGKDRESDTEIAKAAPAPKHQPKHTEGSRAEWKQKVSESRRRNLREGLKALRSRTDAKVRRMERISAARQAEHERLVRMPEREDERLTTPSHNLDLQKLMHGHPPDPNRSARLAQKTANVAAFAESKRLNRQDQMHALYMRARDFIVTPQQLDRAVDEVFGTAENPVEFNGGSSVWHLGRPMNLQTMLNRATRTRGGRALDGADGAQDLQAQRMRRIGEALTGGKIDENIREEQE